MFAQNYEKYILQNETKRFDCISFESDCINHEEENV